MHPALDLHQKVYAAIAAAQNTVPLASQAMAVNVDTLEDQITLTEDWRKTELAGLISIILEEGKRYADLKASEEWNTEWLKEPQTLLHRMSHSQSTTAVPPRFFLDLVALHMVRHPLPIHLPIHCLLVAHVGMCI